MSKQNKIKKSLKASFLDGIFASCMMGLTTDYITPYALSLKASAAQVGILSAAPNLVSSLVQLKSPDIVERFRSRKRIINIFVFLQALMGIPVMFVPYIFKSHTVVFLIIFITLFASLNAFALPAWASLMSEHIPNKARGKYFGWRSKILGAVTIASAFAAGFILHHFRDNVLKGFFIIFFLATLSRFLSWHFLTRMFEPAYKMEKEHYFSLIDFISRIKKSNFAKFVIFAAGLSFCVNLSAPFFPVFMIRDLKFSYITYTVIIVTVAISQIFTVGRWGKIADRSGNIKIVRLTSLIIATLPFWWIINQNPVYLIFVQMVGGFAWSGFNLCATNFIYDAVTPQKRVRCIAYFNVFTGLALCLGALAGGSLAAVLPEVLGYKLLCLFLISGTLRFLAIFLFSGKIKEVRSTENIASKDLFYSVIGIKPLFGTAQDSQQIAGDED